MASLAEIRARLAAQENKNQSGGARTQSDNAIYPHWNISEGATATIRLLPDADSTNDFFWVERQIIKLPFNGIKGQPDAKQVVVQVPCVEMYGDNCPVLAEVRPWYKDDSLKDLANKYWKKRSYLYQGFVRANPLGDDQTPTNPIRRFIISPQIQTVIKSSLMDPELEELPTDYARGLDFNIKKTSKGGYADYSTSNWARKESPLTEAELAAIEAHGLFNLKDFLPKKPSEAELRVIKEMFEASVDGRAYDPDKWGAYYRPYGLEAPAGAAAQHTESAGTSSPVAPKVVDYEPSHAAHSQAPASTNDVPWEEDAAPAAVDPVVVPKSETSTDKAQDILAMIRQRQAK
jgi:hypothetical protein